MKALIRDMLVQLNLISLVRGISRGKQGGLVFNIAFSQPLFDSMDDCKYSIDDREFQLVGKLAGSEYQVDESTIVSGKIQSNTVTKQVTKSYLRLVEVSAFDLDSALDDILEA